MKNLILKAICMLSFSAFSQSFTVYPGPNLGTTLPNPLPPNFVPEIIATNPSLIPAVGTCGAVGNYNVGANDEYEVLVGPSTSGPWTNLFEYNTFVNNVSGTFLGSSRVSFVAFDYSGTVYVKVICTKYPWGVLNAGRIQIKPLSRNIQPTAFGENYFIFPLTASTVVADPNNWEVRPSSDKLSIELDGNRYNNLHLFANKMETNPRPDAQYSYVYTSANNGTNQNIYNYNFTQGSGTNINTIAGKKILIKSGAVLIVPYQEYNDGVYRADNGSIILKNGDEIFIEGGGILKGGLSAIGITNSNIKIEGRGIIDLTNFQKQYTHEESKENLRYNYIRGISIIQCQNVTIKGIIINDPQQLAIELNESSNITIDNVKIFTRVIWGDGIHMVGSNNVTINDCFNRTSDDCISIYASRHVPWETAWSSTPTLSSYKNSDVYNITATNTILYGDNAHAITMGWHGNQGRLNFTGPLDISGTNTAVPGKYLYNIKFNNIDILEHDSNWVQSNGTVHLDYDGAMSINCSDKNECNNILFKNIRVEDFTSGSILRVEVTPKDSGDALTDGNYVRDIRFENLTYTGTGQRKSIIKGIDCTHYIDGVHFENFNIKTNPSATPILVNSANAATYLDIFSDYAYNVTFQEANNYGTSSGWPGLGIPTGVYRIRNASITTNYLGFTASYTPTWLTSVTSTNSLWAVIETNGHYLIRPYVGNGIVNNLTLNNPFAPNTGQTTSPSCQARYLELSTLGTNITNQQWKIRGDYTYNLSNTTASANYIYNVNNAYSRSYLTNKTSPFTNIFASPEKTDTAGINLQNWNFVYVQPLNLSRSNSSNYTEKGIQVYPNPAKDYLSIDNIKPNQAVTFSLFDLKGSEIISNSLQDENSQVYIGNLTDGIYLVVIENKEGVLYCEKFVKIH